MPRYLSIPLILLAVALTAACSDSNNNNSGMQGVGAPAVLECDPASDSCEHANTSLFAISHAFTDPDNTVLYRVSVPAWSTGTDWGDGTNGFFYQATVNDTDTFTYVPFNGVSVGADDRPMLPPFSFIV